MAAYMKAIDIRGGQGDSDALFMNESTPVPKPTEGQALARVKAFGINRMDIIQRRGLYPLPPKTPTTLGVEFSGIIEELGPGDHGTFKKGDEVIGLAYGGAYAEYIAVSTRMLLHKPSTIDWIIGAGIPEIWITAIQALHLALEFAKGKTILWHAGASGVSIAGIQLSRLAGATTILATAGSDEKCEFITKELGATAAFNYKTQDWAEEVLKHTDNKGVDYIVDFIGGDYLQQNITVAARDGRVAILGVLGGDVTPGAVDVSQIMYKRIRIQGTTLRSRDEDYQQILRDKLEEYLPQFASGELKIFVDQVFPWERVAEAHRHIEESKNVGKVICTIS